MLQVYSPIVKLPKEDRKQEFYEELLRLNATELSCCSFGIEEDDLVVVGADRSTKNICITEIEELVSNVSMIAKDYDGTLAEKFSLERSHL